MSEKYRENWLKKLLLIICPLSILKTKLDVKNPFSTNYPLPIVLDLIDAVQLLTPFTQKIRMCDVRIWNKSLLVKSCDKNIHGKSSYMDNRNR